MSSENKIDSPSHYIRGDCGIECIEGLRSAVDDPAFFREHLRLTALAYIWRTGAKGDKQDAVDDLKKARWYIDRLIGEYDEAIGAAGVEPATS